MYVVYILYSDKLKKYYIGSTSNLAERLIRHNSGRSRYTKRGMPWLLAYKEVLYSKQEARKREYQIKSYKGGIQFKQLIKHTGGVA